MTRFAAILCIFVLFGCGKPAHKMSGSLFSGSVPPSSWSTPSWFFDPANATGCASDSNSCTSATCAGSGAGPCLSHAQIVYRLGTMSPTFLVNVTETQLSDQSSPWTDPVSLVPTIGNAGSFTFNGTLLQQTTVALGTFTVRNRSLATTNHITASGQSGAYWATYVGDIVNDTTAGAWFWITKDLGSDTAEITEPLSSIVGSSPNAEPSYVTIGNGDALTIYRPVSSYIKSLHASVPSVLHPIIINHVLITGLADAADIGGSNLRESSVGPVVTLINLNFETSYWNVVNSYLSGQFSPIAGTFVGGAFGPLSFLNTGSYPPPSTLDGDILIESTQVHVFLGLNLGRVYLNSPVDTDACFCTIQVGQYDRDGVYYPDSKVWGPNSFDLKDSVRFVCYFGCTSQLLLTGPLTMDGSTTGFPWVPGSHAYGVAATITPAAIDANNGLFDPRTGNGFMNHP